jgi:hypothetical protein
MGSLAAFNRNRAQQAALQDAAKRQPQQIAESQELANAAPVLVENLDELGSPPYADADQLINVQGDSNLDRELEGMRQAELNRTRVLSPAAREELQNAHLHEPKTKAIPDPDEAGQDRTLKGQKKLRDKAEAPYKDDRVKPIPDGRLRATEPYEDRPDGETTTSAVVTNVGVHPTHEADDQKFVEKLAAQFPIDDPQNSEPPHKPGTPATSAEPKESKPAEAKRRGRASQVVTAEEGEGLKKNTEVKQEAAAAAKKALAEAGSKPTGQDASVPAPDTVKKTADTTSPSKNSDQPDQPSELQKPPVGK